MSGAYLLLRLLNKLAVGAGIKIAATNKAGRDSVVKTTHFAVMLKPDSLAGYALFGIIEGFENHGVEFVFHGLFYIGPVLIVTITFTTMGYVRPRVTLACCLRPAVSW